MSGSANLRNQISFGVELEFFAQLKDDTGEKDPRFVDSIIRHLLAMRLKENPGDQAIAASAECNPSDDCMVCKTAPEGSLVPANRPRMRIYNWAESGQPSHSANDYFLIEEEILNSRWTSGKPWGAKEINSPVFGINESDGGLPALKSIITSLRTLEMPIKINGHCGMHIHVGLGNRLNLLTAKKLITLVTLVEKTLLVPLTSKDRHNCDSARQIIVRSRLADLSKKRNSMRGVPAQMKEYISWKEVDLRPKTKWNLQHPGDIFELLCAVWDAVNLKVLQHLLYSAPDPNDSTSVEIKCALALVLRDKNGTTVEKDSTGPMDFENTPSTFEFRYPQMSMDPVRINTWVRITTRLVEIAMMEPGQFTAALNKILAATKAASAVPQDNDGWRGCEEVLTALGLQGLRKSCREEFARYKNGETVRFLGSKGILQS